MTMKVNERPKPRIFGKGYGSHLLLGFTYVGAFFRMAFQALLNTLVPTAYHEKYHWDIIDLYYKLRGFRHGTDNPKRCTECGSEKLTADEVYRLRDAEKEVKVLKKKVADLEHKIENTPVEPFYPDRAGGVLHTAEEEASNSE